MIWPSRSIELFVDGFLWMQLSSVNFIHLLGLTKSRFDIPVRGSIVASQLFVVSNKYITFTLAVSQVLFLLRFHLYALLFSLMSVRYTNNNTQNNFNIF